MAELRLSEEDAEAFVRWARAKTTGFGPRFDDALRVSKKIADALDHVRMTPETTSTKLEGDTRFVEGRKMVIQLECESDEWTELELDSLSGVNLLVRVIYTAKDNLIRQRECGPHELGKVVHAFVEEIRERKRSAR